MTAGDLLSEDGCPECEASVISVTSDGSVEEFECANGHEWEEQWTCTHCGKTEHDSIEFPQEGIGLEKEFEVGVTCTGVYITPIDGGEGFYFTHDEFRTAIEFFEEVTDE